MENEKLKDRLLEWDGVDTVDNGEFIEVYYHGVFDLLREAADALEQLQAENGRLQAELEKEEAARKKQADILYELRGQKYEQTTAIDQLRAENDRFRRERDEAVIDMTALMAGQCCDLCAVEYCNVRGKTEMCATFKWRGPMEESPEYRISNVGRPSACTTQDVSTVAFHKEGAGDTFVLYPVKEGES